MPQPSAAHPGEPFSRGYPMEKRSSLGANLTSSVPKYRFSREETLSRGVFQVVSDGRKLYTYAFAYRSFLRGDAPDFPLPRWSVLWPGTTTSS